MTKLKSQFAKDRLKEVAKMLAAKELGDSRAVSLAMTKLEEAFMWIDYHMRANKWLQPNDWLAGKKETPIMNKANGKTKSPFEQETPPIDIADPGNLND